MNERRAVLAVLAACLCLRPLAARAERRPVSWSDDACTYRGSYDARVLPAAQVKLALKVIREAGSLAIVDGREILSLPPNPSEGGKDARLSAAEIGRLCAAETARLSVEL
jgi:hypothetical protein